MVRFFLSLFLISSLFGYEYLIKFSHVVSPDTPKGKAVEYFAKRVEELSGGRIKVKVYPNGELAQDNVVIRKMLINNQVQMAAPSIAKFTSIVPELGVFDVPFLFKDEMHVRRVFDGDIGKRLLNRLSQEGYVALGYWSNGFKEITNNKRPIIYPQDIRGLKIRVMSSKILVEQYKALGAIAISMSFSRVYEALKNGYIDGEENTISTIYVEKFYKVQRYMTLTNHGYLGYIVVVSPDFWASLPDDLKKVIKKAFREATIKGRKWAIELNKRALKKLQKIAREGKFRIDYLTPEDRMRWKKIMIRKVYPKFYRVVGKKLIKEIMKLENVN